LGDRRGAQRSTRGTLSLGAFVLGAILLAVMPLVYLFLAFSGAENASIPGTFIILTSTGGMILVMMGAALRD
jgi:hypothetical protein